MPIKAENKGLYPVNWPEIRQAIRQRAKERCEECGVRNRSWGWRDSDGTFHEVFKPELIRMGYKRPPFELATATGALKIIEIVLTVAHLNHDPRDNRFDNLKCWCQMHHLRYDKIHHRESRTGQREMWK